MHVFSKSLQMVIIDCLSKTFLELLVSFSSHTELNLREIEEKLKSYGLLGK